MSDKNEVRLEVEPSGEYTIFAYWGGGGKVSDLKKRGMKFWRLEWKEKGGEDAWHLILPPSKTGLFIQELDEGKAYDFRVQAQGADGAAITEWAEDSTFTLTDTVHTPGGAW